MTLRATYTEKPGHFAEVSKTFSEAEAELDSYNAVYCADGRGPQYIRNDPRMQAIVRHVHETKKPIFTICYGVQRLMAVPVARSPVLAPVSPK